MENHSDFNTGQLLHLNKHDTEIANIHEKLDRCYSGLRYDDFQRDVKKNALEALESDTGRTKIKAYADEAITAYLDKKGEKSFTKWVSGGSLLVAIIAVLVAIFK